jgi:hypothetical protein
VSERASSLSLPQCLSLALSLARALSARFHVRFLDGNCRRITQERVEKQEARESARAPAQASERVGRVGVREREGSREKGEGGGVALRHQVQEPWVRQQAGPTLF